MFGNRNRIELWARFYRCAAALTLAILLMPGGIHADQPPNIVLMLIDDLGAEAVGCYGGESYPTPHIDALAQRGMRYENAYAQPACMVSRAALLTGRYAFRSDLPFNDTPMVRDRGWGHDEITIANVLRDAGYATGISGKWQMCEHEKFPNHLDKLGFTHQNSWAWWKDDVTKRRYWGPGFFRDHQFIDEPNEVYGPDRFCDWTIEFMKQQVAAGKPFLAYYPMVLVHHPFPQTPDNMEQPQPGWKPEDNFLEHPHHKFSQSNFEAMVAYTDKLVGRMTTAIDDLGVAENTLFILTADNGTIGKVTSRCRGRDVQGGKMKLNESGSRVPFIVSWKGKIAAGSVNDSLIDFSDLAPTLAEVAGTEMPDDRVIDGQSFLPQLLGQPDAPERDWVFSRYRDRSFVRGEKYRLSNNGDLHDLSGDRYRPKLIPREESLPKNAPESEATKARMELAGVFESLGHPVGPQAGSPPRLSGPDGQPVGTDESGTKRGKRKLKGAKQRQAKETTDVDNHSGLSSLASTPLASKTDERRLVAKMATDSPNNGKRPNIVFIFTDDHCQQALSAYDDSRMVTPNMDRIAEEGMRFNKCYVTNSICGPSRATILTGKYSHLNGFIVNGGGPFDGSQTTFPKLLQAAGYETGIIGKWHLQSTPTGFDHYDVLVGQGPYYNPPMKTRGDNGEPTVVNHQGYTTEIITEKTLDWLRSREGDQPFMLMCQHKAPHRNWMPAPKYLNWLDDVEIEMPATFFDDQSGRAEPASRQEMTIAEHMNPRDLKLARQTLLPKQRKAWDAAYGPKNQAFLARRDSMSDREIAEWKYQRYVKDYLRCVKSVDDSVGSVLEYLDESGLADNTIVIYSADQGWFLGEHGWYDKRWMYEESLKTPLLVRWPGVTQPGSVNDDQIVSNLDFAQTFLDAASVEAPSDMQGASLVPLLRGEAPDDWRDSFYYHFYEFPSVHKVARHHGVTDGKHKLIRYYGPNHDGDGVYDTWEQFDLVKDPDELQSVHGQPDYVDVTQRLKQMLVNKMAEFGVPPESDDPKRPKNFDGRSLQPSTDATSQRRQQVADESVSNSPSPRRPSPDGALPDNHLVTLETLLTEMTDREVVAQLDAYPFTLGQFSSYDRAAKAPGSPGWFANGDQSKFLRTENNNGRTEEVMMDAEGPGAIVRFWLTMAGPHSGKGTLRFYIDGSEAPAIEGNVFDIISRGSLAPAPLSESVSKDTDELKRGHNLFLPIPYSKSCKVTFERADKGAFYYAINYRLYDPRVKIESYSPGVRDRAEEAIKLTASKLRETIDPVETTPARKQLSPGQSHTIKLDGPAAIDELAIRLSADDLEQALRSTVMSLAFDGEQTVWCPVGDFFGTGHQLHPYRSWYTAAKADGTLISRWVMPFKESATLTLKNLAKAPVTIERATAKTRDWSWDQRSLYFHAAWKNWHKINTLGAGTGIDMNFITVQGQGKLVGDSLTLYNGSPVWWGEGDEKIYVDGETFPSHFGTGTEDYYGYAWCEPAAFAAPFNTQPSGQGNKNAGPGFTVNSRYRALDTVPFNQSLQFDMELWHWRRTKMNYAPATFWYARPGATDNATPVPGEASRPVAKTVTDLVQKFEGPPGAIEAEMLVPDAAKATSGELVNQRMRVGWSGDRQLWWKDGQPGDSVSLRIPDRKYPPSPRLTLRLTKAPDYGQVQVILNGEKVGEPIDLYASQIENAVISPGFVKLLPKDNVLEFELVGKHPKAKPRYMLGIDYIHFRKN